MTNKAFLLGINSKGLKYCDRDVLLMKECLEKYDFQVFIPNNFTTKGYLTDTFEDWTDKTDKTDKILFYYSGHGLLKNQLFLLLSNVEGSKSELSINRIIEPLKSSKANEKIIILDCCHANSVTEGCKLEQSERYRILTASEKLQSSKEIDSLKSSFLTYHIRKGLVDDYAEIINKNYEIRINELYEWLKSQAKEYNKNSKDIIVPEPNLLGNQKLNFLFAKVKSNKINTSKTTDKSSPPRPPFFLDQPDTIHFTGREKEIDTLKKILIDKKEAKVCSIVGLSGTGGIGKSALAYHFATEYKDSFPDGVIGIKIEDKEINEIARQFAKHCTDISEFEEGTDATTMMQQVFRHLRMLLIFDNANSSKIRNLLPGGSRCAVIVTTRDRRLPYNLDISDLGTIDLPFLPVENSIRLLKRILKKKRIEDEIDAAYKIVDLVGGLPLAIKIVGGALKRQKSRSLSFYAASLKDEKERLNRIDRERDYLNVRASLSLSLDLLSEDELNFFACLSICAKNSFSRQTAMVTGGCEDEFKTDDYLTCLYNLSLLNISEVGKNRYVFHSLIRILAQELAVERGLQKEAAKRHAEFFIEYVKSSELDFSVASFIAEEFDDIVLASKWLQHQETSSIEQEKEKYQFAVTLQPFFEQYGYWEQAVDLMREYQKLAESNKDWNIVVKFIIQQAKYLSFQGKYSNAEAILNFIPEILVKIEEEETRQLARAKWLTTLGGILMRQEEFDEAIDVFERAIAIDSLLDNKEGLSMALNSLSGVYRRLRNFEKAEKTLHESYRIAKQLGSKLGMGKSLNHLGQVYQAQDRLDEAMSAFQLSYNIFEDLQHQRSLLMLSTSIGTVFKKQNNFDEAVNSFKKSVFISQQLESTIDTIRKLRSLGGLFYTKGDLEKALDAYQRSVELCKELDDQLQLGFSLNSLGKVMFSLGRLKEAYRSFQHSVSIGEKLSNVKHTAVALINLSGVLIKQKKFDKVLFILQRYQKITEELDCKEERSSVKRSLKGMLKEQNDLNEITLVILERIKISKTIDERRSLATFLDCIHPVLQERGLIDKTLNILFFLEKLYQELEEKTKSVLVLNRLSNAFQKQGSLNEAVAALQRAADIVERDLNNQPWFSNILASLGNTLKEQGSLDEAVDALQRSAEIKEKLNNQPELAVVKSDLAEVFQKQGYLDEAIDALQRSADIEEELGNQPRLINTLTKLGDILRQHENSDKARNVFQRIADTKKELAQPKIEELQRRIAFKENIGDLKGQVIVLSNLAGILQQHEFLEEADKVFNKLVEINTKLEDQKNLAITLLRYSWLLREQSDFDKARKKLQCCYEIFNVLDDLSNIASVCSSYKNLAEDFAKNKDFTKAEDVLQNSIDICEDLDDSETLAILLHSQSEIFEPQKKWHEAEKALRRSYDILVKSKDLRGQAMISNSLGQILRKKQGEENFQSALMYFRQSIKLGKELDDLQQQQQHLAQVHTAMGQALQEHGDLKEAADCFIKGYEIDERSKNKKGLEIVTPYLTYVLVNKLKRRDEALTYCQRAIEIFPTSNILLNLREKLIYSSRIKAQSFLKKRGTIKFIRQDKKTQKYWGYIAPYDKSKEIKFEEGFVDCNFLSQLRNLDHVEVYFVHRKTGKLFANKIKKIDS